MGRRTDRRRRLTQIVIDRAMESPRFREELLRDPRGAIERDFGMPLPGNLEVQVLEEGPNRAVIVLPEMPPGKDATVTLREITADTVGDICALQVRADQEGFVAPNAISIAQAHFSPLAWFRGIYADDTPVGFVMLRDNPEEQNYYLWRYMIDGEYQGKGFGRKALELVIEYVRSRPGANEFFLSFVPGEGSPRDFYAQLGFVETGVQHGPELEMRLDLNGSAGGPTAEGSETAPAG